MSKILMMMSGGIDSSIAALLLKKAGHDVVGLTLALWFDQGTDTCCGVAANCKAKDVCDKLGIEHYALNKRMDFIKYVVNPYIDAHKNGLTPSPCINCNTHVKIGGMFKYAEYFNCDYVATGHYAKVIDNKIRIATDKVKDQSYMLSQIKSDVIPRLIFPLGDILKSEVHEIAKLNNIQIPSDSQDLCFVEKNDRSEFLQSHGIIFEDGNILDKSGNVLGTHDGIYNYTIGQRKGLPSSDKGPLYVIRIDRQKNNVIVDSENGLLAKTCTVKDFNWQYTPKTNDVYVKIRYRAPLAPATFESVDQRLLITFKEMQKAITPGQCLVMYDKDNTLIGGGWITN